MMVLTRCVPFTVKIGCRVIELDDEDRVELLHFDHLAEGHLAQRRRQAQVHGISGISIANRIQICTVNSVHLVLTLYQIKGFALYLS